MSGLRIVLLVAIVAAVIGAGLIYSRAGTTRGRQIRVHFGPLGPYPHTEFNYGDWAHAFWADCAPMALALDEQNSDYSIEPHWEGGRWKAEVGRSDNAYIYAGEDPDSHRLLRAACRAIRSDSPGWISLKPQVPPSELGEPTRDAARPSDRFELREVRNGSLATTAMIDKRSGRIWIWTKYSDGRSGFLEEDVTPQPEHD